MYAVQHFTQKSVPEMRAYLAENPFAALVVNTANGPTVDHIPLEFDAGSRSEGRLLGHVARSNPLWQEFESARTTPWRMTDAPAEYIGRLVGGVVGVELQIDSMVGKWKLSQNRPPEDRDGVMAGLRQEGGPEGAALASLIAIQDAAEE